MKDFFLFDFFNSHFDWNFERIEMHRFQIIPVAWIFCKIGGVINFGITKGYPSLLIFCFEDEAWLGQRKVQLIRFY